MYLFVVSIEDLFSQLRHMFVRVQARISLTRPSDFLGVFPALSYFFIFRTCWRCGKLGDGNSGMPNGSFQRIEHIDRSIFCSLCRAGCQCWPAGWLCKAILPGTTRSFHQRFSPHRASFPFFFHSLRQDLESRAVILHPKTPHTHTQF